MYFGNFNSPQKSENKYRVVLTGTMLKGLIECGVRSSVLGIVIPCSGQDLTVSNVWNFGLLVAVFDGERKLWEEVEGPYVFEWLRLAK